MQKLELQQRVSISLRWHYYLCLLDIPPASSCVSRPALRYSFGLFSFPLTAAAVSVLVVLDTASYSSSPSVLLPTAVLAMSCSNGRPERETLELKQMTKKLFFVPSPPFSSFPCSSGGCWHFFFSVSTVCLFLLLPFFLFFSSLSFAFPDSSLIISRSQEGKKCSKWEKEVKLVKKWPCRVLLSPFSSPSFSLYPTPATSVMQSVCQPAMLCVL